MSTFHAPALLDGDPLPLLRWDYMPADANPVLWAKEHPAALRDAQREFLAAGAKVLRVPTSRANRNVLSACGRGSEAAEITEALALSVKATAGKAVPVGGCLGPSGLLVPPLGEADFDDLYELYREQVRALDGAGVDFLLLEGHQTLADLRAAILAARTTDLPVLATLELDESGRTIHGASLLAAVITLQAMGVEAVGLCAKLSLLDPEWISAVLPHASVPILVCGDAENASPEEFAETMLAMLRAGAAVAGGIGGTLPIHITALRKAMDSQGPLPVQEAYEDADNYAAATESEAFFLGNDIVYSEPMPCTQAIAEKLIAMESGVANAALFEVDSLDDALLLAQEGQMSHLPMAVRCSSLPVLDAALRYFQGRLIIDTDCPLEEAEIEPLAAKYGAILY